MSISLSTLGKVNMLSSILQGNQSQLTNLSEELSSGQKSATLSGYGEQARQVVDLHGSINAANAYVATTNTVSTFLNGYDNSLTELVSDATKLSQSLANLTDATSGTATAAFNSLVPGLQLDVTTTLNTQVGNRYIFAGTRYATAPVQPIASLPALTTPTAFTAVTSPTLPAYDTQAPGTSTGAWASPTATIAQSETISYGINSNDPAIQQLVFALQNAAAATTATEPNRSQYISLAQSAAQQAASALQTLQAKNGANLSQVNSTQTAQKQSVSTLTNMLDGIDGVDTTQLSVQISSLQTQMEASYKVTATLLNLSLTSYLGTSTG